MDPQQVLIKTLEEENKKLKEDIEGYKVFTNWHIDNDWKLRFKIQDLEKELEALKEKEKLWNPDDKSSWTLNN